MQKVLNWAGPVEDFDEKILPCGASVTPFSAGSATDVAVPDERGCRRASNVKFERKKEAEESQSQKNQEDFKGPPHQTRDKTGVGRICGLRMRPSERHPMIAG
jgi:hypothetical protein